MAGREINGVFVPDTSRADNLMARLEMNAMHDARRGTVTPPEPSPVFDHSGYNDPNDPTIPGTNMRFSELRAMQEQRAIQQAMAEQQRLLGSTGALAPASAPMPAPAIRPATPVAPPSAALPTGFLQIDLLTWEVVADNGQRFPIMTQDEGRSVIAFCYNIMMRAINLQTQQLRASLGLPEPTLPANTGLPQQQFARQLQETAQEAIGGNPAAGNEGVQTVPRKKARRKVQASRGEVPQQNV